MRRPLLALLFALALVAAACAGPADTGDEVGSGDTVATTEATTTSTIAEEEMPMEGGEHAEDEHAEDEHAEDEHAEDEHAHEAALTILDPTTEAAVTVEMVAKEFAYDPAEVTVPRHEPVRFVVRNEGAIQHEFRISTTEAIQAHLAEGHAGHDMEMMPGEPMVMEGDLVVLIDPGQTVEVVVEFAEDAAYDEIACLLPGHYEAGMKASLTLEG